MNPASHDLRDLLVTGGIGSTASESSWGIYRGKEPLSPDTTITLYDYGGPVNPKWRQDEVRVQARIRGNKNGYDEAWQKAKDVSKCLVGIPKQTINGTVYVGIWVVSDVTFSRYDDNDRPIFTVNFRVIREPTDDDHRSQY